MAYGLLGAPLAFGSLPLYVALPHHYAQYPGVALPALGAVLLAARVLDAAIDPAVLTVFVIPPPYTARLCRFDPHHVV